jgi:xylono-1,5-lactonase
LALMTGEPRNVWNLAADLGEGPVWIERDQALWFVNIKGPALHRYDPATDEKRSFAAPELIGFALPARSGGFIAGLQSGLHKFDPSTGSFSLLAEVEPNLPGNRLNDAVCDPSGAMWFGSMDVAEKDKSGAFHRFSDGEVRPTGIGNIPITNGPAVSPNGKILYFVDTLGRTIRAADINPDGTLGPARPFVQIADGEGYPDGPTIDAEGCVWISLYAGWETRRYSPKGDLLERVRFPVANITKIAFGGPDLRTAFATTARQFLTPEELERQPEAGDLFVFEVDVPGVPCPLVAD